MRRNWFCGLLFALALAIQAFSPGATALARSNAVLAKSAYELCWKTAQSGSRQDEDSNQRELRHLGCVFCQASSSGLTPFAPTASAADFVSTDSYLLVAHAVDAPAPPSPFGKARRARAPPHIS
jgi:hypothetical protein